MLEKSTKEYIDSKILPILEINRLKNDNQNKYIMSIILVIIFVISLIMAIFNIAFFLMSALSWLTQILIYKEVMSNIKKLKKLEGELKNV